MSESCEGSDQNKPDRYMRILIVSTYWQGREKKHEPGHSLLNWGVNQPIRKTSLHASLLSTLFKGPNTISSIYISEIVQQSTMLKISERHVMCSLPSHPYCAAWESPKCREDHTMPVSLPSLKRTGSTWTGFPPPCCSGSSLLLQ